MTNRALAAGLLLAGTLIAAMSLLADVIGLGAQPGVIGWKQILGVAVGLLVAFIGVVIALRGRSTKET